MGISWMMMCCRSSSTMRRTSATEGRFSFGLRGLGAVFFFCGSVWNGGSRYSKNVFGRIQILWIFWREYLQWSCCTVSKCRKYIQFHIDPIFQRNKCMHWTKLGRDIFRMMNCWSSIQPAKVFQNMLFWKSQLAICHVETIFWWSGTLLELFSENNKRVRSWDYLENGHFFGEKIGEGILENCPLQKKGIFQVKRWGFWPPQKPYLKAAWHEESVQESSHLLGNLDFRCPNVRDPLNWLTFVCWKPIFLVVISVRSCSPMLTEQCWTTMGRTERHRGPKMLSCSVVFFPQAGMVSSLKLGEEQIF